MGTSRVFGFLLSEIAERLGASRQAVHDLISRSRDRLEELEGLLGFHGKEETLENEIRSLREAAAGINSGKEDRELEEKNDV